MDLNPTADDDSAFRGRSDEYSALMRQPWHQLRMALIWATLAQHVEGAGGRWLDVGCGDGELALRALDHGYDMTLVDSQPEMCVLARQRLAASSGASTARWRVLDGHLGDLPGRGYSIVTAHNVLEYVTDRRAAIRALAERVRPGGIISIVVANPAAVPFTVAVRTQSPHATRKALETGGLRIGLKGARTTAPPVDLVALDQDLVARGMSRRGYYGIRIFNDVMTDEKRKIAPGWLEQMLATELLAAEQEPYRSIARHLHVIYR